MGSLEFEDYYGVLNLSPDCTENEISAAFRRLSLIYHPDRHRELFMEEEVTEAFTKIQKAYEVLRNPVSRQLFDRDREEYSKSNMQLVPTVEQNYDTSNIVEERDNMRKKLKFLEAAQVSSTTMVGLNLVELLDPLDSDSTLIERLLESDVKYIKFNQSTEFVISSSDLITINSNCSVRNGNGDAEVELLLHHKNSNTLSNAVSVGIGSSQRVAYTVSKAFFNHSKCHISVYAQKVAEAIGFSYELTLENTLVPNITSSFTCMGYNPPVLTFQMEYLQPKLSTKLLSQVNKKRFIYGAQVEYMLTKNFSLGLAGKISNFEPSLSYSLGYSFDKINLISGNVSLSPNKGVMLKLRYTRQNHNYTIPVYLSDSVTAAAVVFGTIGGIAVVSSVKLFLLKTLTLWDYVKINKLMESQKIKLILKKREQAVTMIELMKSTYDSVVARETKVGGLLIVAAYIGPHMDKPDFLYNPSIELANVKIPVQCLVKDSKLIMNKGSKLSIPGFYQPETFDPLYLMIKYCFRGKLHQIICPETEAVALPKKAHCIV